MSLNIKITIATNHELVNEGVKALMSNSNNYKRSIGLDFITKRTRFSTTRSVRLLQLSDGIQCIIVRLDYFSYPPESLYTFLSLPAFTFAGFGIRETMSTLNKEYGLVCKNTLEAGPSGWHHSHAASVAPLRRLLAGMHIPASCSISDFWDQGIEITEEMIKLAVSNAFAAFQVGENILKSYG